MTGTDCVTFSMLISHAVASETYKVPGIQVSEWFFRVPLDHLQADDERQITIHIRICASRDLSDSQLATAKHLVFFQGGPGFECGAVPQNSGMLRFLLRRNYTVIYLDQRGTGMSTPLTSETIALEGSLDSQVAYCKKFRADSIVRDCELIRRGLGISKWTLLGQSYGGFIILTYLSLHPESLEAVILTGGMAPISQKQPDEVYHRLVKKIEKRNEEFYDKYPQDITRVNTILSYLERANLKSPNGGNLTPTRFRQLGLDLGMHGGFDHIHNLISKVYYDLSEYKFLTYKSRALIEESLHYDGNPIYAIFHESIYCQTWLPSNWSAYRALEASPRFRVAIDHNKPTYLFGETILPSMFDDYSQLQPMKELAHRLAQEPWTSLYNLEKLKHNTVPFVASCYIEDMYVHIDLAIEALQCVGNTRDLVTNRWLHNGLRHAPEELLSYLFNLLHEDEPRA